jgi:hypothetical protein
MIVKDPKARKQKLQLELVDCIRALNCCPCDILDAMQDLAVWLPKGSVKQTLLGVLDLAGDGEE